MNDVKVLADQLLEEGLNLGFGGILPLLAPEIRTKARQTRDNEENLIRAVLPMVGGLGVGGRLVLNNLEQKGSNTPIVHSANESEC